MNRPHQAPHRWPGVAAWFALVALVLSACGGAPAAPAANQPSDAPAATSAPPAAWCCGNPSGAC